jgi:glycosyltransferase involved in cell wall biosynthesis
MDRSLTVSVVITTFNYGEFIVEAIESVLAQSRPADEIIVIDDGSTDSTPDLVAPYVERGALRYIRQENQGPSVARNRGIAETTGELIAFLDADDTWLPDKLAVQVDWLERHPEAALVSGQMIWWHVPRNERTVMHYRSFSHRKMCRELTVRNVAGNPSMMLIRRTALDLAGGYDPALRWGQDWEIVIRLARYGTVGFVPEPVTVYRWHRGSLSHEGRTQQIEMNLSISRKAIGGFDPAWQRPVLLARAWSLAQFERARLYDKHDVRRSVIVRAAALAFLAWPFEDSRAKAGVLGKSLVSDGAYRRARAGVRSRFGRAR